MGQMDMPTYPLGSEPTVVSDKDDYAPGETAIITGSGWTLDTSVRIHIDEDPHYDHHNDFNVAVKSDGTWVLPFQIDERHLGVAFHLEATGNVTGYVSETSFTDALNTQLNVEPATGVSGEAILLSAKLVQNQGGSGGRLGVGNGNGVPGMTVIFSLNNRVVGEGITNSSGVASLSTNIPNSIAPGTYVNGVSATYTKPHQGEYNGSNGSAMLTVNPAQAITSFSSLSSPSVTYGSASATLSGVILSTNGVPTGSVAITLNGVTQSAAINSSTGAFSADFSTSTLGVGSSPYTITYLYAGNSNFTAISDATKSLTVSPRSVEITAEAKSKFCGQIDPALTYAITSGSLVGSDVFIGSLTREAGENVGSYAIEQGSVALNSNYALTYMPANLSINRVNLDASDASNPRNFNNIVEIKVLVKDDAVTSINGVSVKLFINEIPYGPVSSNNGVATFTLTKFDANVYAVRAEAGSGCSETASVVYMPIYNPDGGFVTGGGWINSPQNTGVRFMQVAGNGNFGFNAKYKTGKNEVNQVDGSTTFHVNAGGMNFKSSSHAAMSLVISNHKATYTGEGTINGQGGYEFRVIAVDGDIIAKGTPDRFRIKIWDKFTKEVVYDNEIEALESAEPTNFSTQLGGGSVVIHTPKGGGANKREVSEATIDANEILATTFTNYPNTFSDRTNIAFVLAKDESFSLEVYDIRGIMISKVASGMAEAGRQYEYEVDGSRMTSGMFIARLVTPSGVQVLRMIKK